MASFIVKHSQTQLIQVHIQTRPAAMVYYIHSEHVAHASKKMSLFGEKKNDFLLL